MQPSCGRPAITWIINRHNRLMVDVMPQHDHQPSNTMPTPFCPSCGTQIPETAKFCPGCGASVDSSSTSADSHQTEQPQIRSNAPPSTNGHSKTTAVLLGLFFGGFSYLYTAKVDGGKFGGSIIGAIMILCFGAGGLQAETAGDGKYMFFGVCAMIAGFIWGVVPLLIAATRTQAWYDDYDREHGRK